MNRVIAAYASLGSGCAYLLTTRSAFYDIDTANEHWESMHNRECPYHLPSEYSIKSMDDLRYSFTTPKNFSTLQLDAQTKRWIAEKGGGESFWQSMALMILSTIFVSFRDAQGWLDLPAVHLLSQNMWSEVLQTTNGRPGGRCLDVGAGAGHITRAFKHNYDEIYAVEISDGLVWRLQKLGFYATRSSEVSAVALSAAGLPASFDAVFALNLLDRVERSDDFLDDLIALTRPGGTLVIALPLPYMSLPWTSLGKSMTVADRDDWNAVHGLSLRGPNENWEEAALAVIDLLERHGLEVKHIARAPYLAQRSFFDHIRGPQALDGALFIARRPKPGTTDLKNARSGL